MSMRRELEEGGWGNKVDGTQYINVHVFIDQTLVIGDIPQILLSWLDNSQP